MNYKNYPTLQIKIEVKIIATKVCVQVKNPD